MPRPIRTVFFDLDGTLLDSIRLILDSYHHTLAVHGLPARPDAHWLTGIGTPIRSQFGEWAHDQALLDAMIATYRDYNLAHHDGQVRAYPGAVELVRRIRELGLQTGLVTSKMRTGAERGLRVLGLLDAMDVIVGVDDVVHAKPHPEPVLVGLDRLGADANTAVYVGDSVHDMKCGRAAGTLTAAVLWGPFSRQDLEPTAPDYWLEQPQDLLAVVTAGGPQGRS